LLLYGSLRADSYSRLAAEEGARVLQALGCEVQFFDPTGLGAPDDPTGNPDKVTELR
jgi:arsenic resistance protein ArsH